MNEYAFQGSISERVLESYLARAVTAAGLVNSDTLDDDLRMIANIGAKFLGRSSGVWEMEADDEAHFAKSERLAARVHAIDGDIILQTCIFEAIFKEANRVPIPAWVFEAFGLPPEERTFQFERMLFDNRPAGYVWDENGAIPNIDKTEAQLWFYYRAARYIDAGFEAIHMGQIHLYTADDIGFAKTYALFDKIRAYAAGHARRGMVLLDAHTHGVNVGGRLLFDFHSMPYSRMPILDKPGDSLALVREGFSEGGTTPSGWQTDSLPLLMEFDNWGGKFFKEEDGIPFERRAWMEWWGYDQITWFASRSEERRNAFLDYTYKWTATHFANAHFQMPVRRTLGNCRIVPRVHGIEAASASVCYQANMPGAGCPLGFGQEETIKRIWSDAGDWRQHANVPRTSQHYGGEEEYDPSTGVKLPSRVIVYGDFQHHAGAVNHDSNSETTRMYYAGDGRYALACVFPYPGEYEYAVAPYGTLSQTYSIDRYPRSGSSTKAKLIIEQANTVVVFRYDFADRRVTAETIG
ncbi:hypothetical protein [Paenibacillus glycinis]|uniref:Uncharacterized protein n=1 Tax=Paenibacillus glycinis TaxID=2697035 RepID=A0ABW9XYI6_9BACL|nr:hypothetical protein [Paenibacillus glycinis]NBD27296.1 hypothetical protein [Paenibacillus glycinis]